jgi:thiol-disulfide isomerase/thioredoxin
MKITYKASLFILFCFITKTSFSQEFTCKIRGTVIDRDSKEIFITPVSEDFNNVVILQKGITIPIIDNKFEFELKFSSVEAYFLIFKEQLSESGFRIAGVFFPDTTNIEIKLYPDNQYMNNIFIGGEINKLREKYDNLLYFKTKDLLSIRDSLHENNKYMTEKYKELTNKIYHQAKNEQEKAQFIKERRLLNDSAGKYTPEAFAIEKKLKAVYDEYEIWKLNYLKTEINIYSYYLLFNMSKSNDSTRIHIFKSVFPLYAAKYPSHIYTEKLKELLLMKNVIRVGGNYIDFKAPTIDGKIISISDSIKGKVAVIDLWSTWCGPCRQLSKSMIPIYEKYKNKGFTIIGVCGVYKDMAQYTNAMKEDKYPWLNLIEFNNQLGIWSKYGAEGSGGLTILVDSTGKILSISPGANELDEILKDLLK